MWWKKIARQIQDLHGDGAISFGAGFGPSGLPHVGTLCEILWTNCVKTTIESLKTIETQLFVVSDDLDALKKIPTTFPKNTLLNQYLGTPLCNIPDPFENSTSLSAGINARLDGLLNPFGIKYKFIESSSCYRSGEYNPTIYKFLRHHREIMVALSSRVGPTRRKSYSIFMPISAYSGKIIEHLVIQNIDLQRGLITYRIPSNLLLRRGDEEYSITSQEYYANEPVDQDIVTSVYDGNCKLQWKADWAMRLIHRKIAFEMHGEDLMDSANAVREICEIMGEQVPVLMRYGLFTDAAGRKISKSRGNGFSLEQAFRYMPREALQHFMFNNPFRATRFHPEISIQAYDNYRLDHARAADNNHDNAVNYFPIPPTHPKRHASYRRILNIFSACHPADMSSAKTYLLEHGKSRQDITSDASFQTVVKNAFLYYSDFIAPRFRPILLCSESSSILKQLCQQFLQASSEHQTLTAEGLARIFSKLNLIKGRIGYATLYACLFGEENGPRLLKYINRQGLSKFCDELCTKVAEASTQKENDSMIDTPNTVLSHEPASDLKHPPKLPRATVAIDFDAIQLRAAAFSEHLQIHSEAIAKSLSKFECHNVIMDEIARCAELLEGLDKNKKYFEKRIHCVTSYLPLNQPIYATTCFGVIPSLMTELTWLRPPTAMHAHYKKLVDAMQLANHFPNLHVSFEDKEAFVQYTAEISDAVIFTGTVENAAKVRKSYRRSTLFILNGAGHNPLVIANNASVEQAVESALRVVLYNQGQDCAGPNSIMVQSCIYDDFINQLHEKLGTFECQVGDYSTRSNIVGPNSDPDHTLKVIKLFKENREYCTYGGEINPISGLIRPTVFGRPLSLGGNYREFFAPVFFIQKYEQDAELSRYFGHPLYGPNSMYVSVFGDSEYINALIASGEHKSSTVLRNTDLHLVEKGYNPYGGYGTAASCLYVNGVRIAKPTLPQRDIHEHLVALSP